MMVVAQFPLNKSIEPQEVTKIQTGDAQQLHMFPQILMQSSYLFAK